MKINRYAFTLLEIIFSSLIFGIVVLGIVTSNIALQKNSKNSADTYYTIQNTNVTLNKILRDASLMVGAPSSPGYAGAGVDGSGNLIPVNIGNDFQGANLFAVYTGDPNTFCFYQGFEPYNVYHKTASGDPVPVFNSGPWICYTFAGNQIYRCQENAKDPAAALNSYPPLEACGAGNSIGHAKVITPNFSLDSCSTVNNAACNSHQKVIFSIDLKNCPDPNSAQCSPGSSNYPYIEKSGSVSPAAQSAG